MLCFNLDLEVGLVLVVIIFFFVPDFCEILPLFLVAISTEFYIFRVKDNGLFCFLGLFLLIVVLLSFDLLNYPVLRFLELNIGDFVCTSKVLFMLEFEFSSVYNLDLVLSSKVCKCTSSF